MPPRPRLTVVPDPGELRRRWNLKASALRLPEQLGGKAVEWRPWNPPLRITHLRDVCERCGVLEEGATARGLVARPRARGRPRAVLVRYMAFGCLACRAVDVIDIATLDQRDAAYAWSSHGQQVLF